MGGADRRRYVMSVELAMQREMAYRKKLENPKTKESGSTASVIIPQKDRLPSQVQTSTPNLTPGQIQNLRPATPVLFPNPRLHPTVGLRPQQMQAPPQMRTSTAYTGLNSIKVVQRPSFDHTITQNSMMRPSVGFRPEQATPQRVTATTPMLIPNPRPFAYPRPSITPALPQRFNPQHSGLTLNSITHMSSSIQGPHSSLTRPPRPTFLAHQKRKTPVHNQTKAKRLQVLPEDFHCDLCQVDCTSELNLRMHLKGHKHKSMVRNAQAKKAIGGTSEPNDKLYCESCGIWCGDSESLFRHLNGKSHYFKLRAKEKKLMAVMGPNGATAEIH